MKHGINRQIAAYFGERGLKHHQKEQISRIAQDWPNSPSTILDVGCANGVMIQALGDLYPNALKHGIDLSPELVAEAKSKLVCGYQFVVADVITYKPDRKFDVIVASGIMSIFEDFITPLELWLSWLEDGGRLYVFGPFNSADIDTKILFRNNNYGSDWEGGLTSYSKTTVSCYLEKAGKYSYEFQKFSQPESIPKRDNPIRNHTIKMTGGESLLVNGANIISEYFFLSILKG